MGEKFKRIDLKIEKILDTDFRYQLFEMLQEAGIKGTEANSIVLNKYKEAIKKAAINRLKEVCDCIRQENFDRLNELLTNSPAGDGYGRENTYIRFDDICYLEDIGSICTTLKNLAHGKSVESIALLVYLIGCLVSLIIFVVRYARSSAVLGETMYFPILVLTSWFYVIILLCHGRRY